MATETKIIEVKVDVNSAITQLGQLMTKLDEINKAQETDASLKAKNKVLADSYKESIRILAKEIKTEVNEIQSEIGAYQKLQIEYNKASLAAKNLAASKGVDNAETIKAIDYANKLNDKLKTIDSGMGVFNRNVGNYSSATKMLGINLGQVLKEAPNFAISARIGIMSLTNNIPMLAESIRALKLEQEALGNSMKMKDWIKLISQSVFGLTGIMSIAMVIMQAYGADIIKWVGSLFKGKEAVDNLTLSQKASNKTFADMNGEAEKKIESVTKLGIEIEKYGNSAKYSKQIVDDFNKTFNTHYTTIEQVKKAYPELSKAAIDAAIKIQAANTLIQDSAQSTLRIQEAQTKLAPYSKKQISEQEKMLDELVSYAEKSGYDLNKLTTELINGQTNIFRWFGGGSSKEMELYKFYQKPENLWFAKYIAQLRKYTGKSGMLRQEIDKLLKDVSFENMFGGGKNPLTGNSFNVQQELLDLAVKQNVESMSKDLLEVEKWNNAKTAKYKFALKERKITQEEYDSLMISLRESTEQQINNIWAKWFEKDAKTYKEGMEKVLKEQKDAIDKQVKEFWKAVNAFDRQEAELYRVEVKKAQTKLNKDIAKGIIDAKDFEQLRILNKDKEIADLRLRGLVKGTAEYNEAIKAINEKYDDQEIIDAQTVVDLKIQAYERYASAVSSIMGGLSQTIQNFHKSELDSYANSIKGKANYNELYAKKKFELETQDAILTRSVASFDTIVNTASAIMKAAPNVPLQVLQGIAGAAQLAAIWSAPMPSYEATSSTGSSTTQTTTVTEKFHTGGVGDKPDSQTQSDEITKTLLRSERILSPVQTNIFDNIVSKMQSYGGSDRITANVGTQGMSDYLTLKLAMSEALQNQKAPQISWTEFSNQAQRQQQLQNNRFIR